MVAISKQEKKRLIWAVNRSVLELDKMKHRRDGKKSKSHWNTFEGMAHIFAWILKIIGWYNKGIANAKNVRLQEFTLHFNDLPKAFDNYRILHLTDLHIDSLPGFEDVIVELIKPLQYDICVLTGTDDPFHYYTEQALIALEEKQPGFKIALIHRERLP